MLAEVAELRERRLEPDAKPEKGYFFRSDHFEFAKRGVPALFTNPGFDDLRLLLEFGFQLADGHDWPNWHEGSEFRSIRDEMRSVGP